MTYPPGVDASAGKRNLLREIVAYVLDTVMVYTLALRVSGMLVALWFAWAPRLFQISTIARPSDWYLQHLELITIVPAFIAGYIDVGRIVPALLGGLMKDRRVTSAAMWAWSIPTMILSYEMLKYRAPTSILIGSSMSALRYFFDIQRVMPTFTNFSASDPVRVLQQMTITAPFYAGVAYSVGALSHRYRILSKLFTFEKPEEVPLADDGGPSTLASPSSSPD
jgi:hypothetical protein